MTSPSESVSLDPRDANEGFLEVLIGVSQVEKRYMGSPDLVRAIIKPVSEGLRLVKKHDPFTDLFGYQVEIFADDTQTSIEPHWYPLGHVRSVPEHSLKLWHSDLADHNCRMPGLKQLMKETLELTCNRCQKKHSINRAFIRFDEIIQCPHCGTTAEGEDNIHISPYA